MQICPCKGCPMPVPSHRFACVKHWGMMDHELQTAIAETWPVNGGRPSGAAQEARMRAVTLVFRKENDYVTPLQT